MGRHVFLELALLIKNKPIVQPTIKISNVLGVDHVKSELVPILIQHLSATKNV